jgi:hypothetical protein
MTNQDTATPGKASYYVLATAPAGSSVTVNPNANIAYGERSIQLIASNVQGSGSTTVTFTAMEHINGQPASTDVPVPGLTPITQQYTVVQTTDIKSYTVEPITTPLYDVADPSSTNLTFNPTTGASTGTAIAGTSPKQSWIGNSSMGDYEPETYIYGLTSGGGKVALKNTDILSASVDNANDFTTDLTGNYNGTANVYVYAKNTLSSTKPTSSGTLTIAVKSDDGLVHTATTKVTSQDVLPVASSVGVHTDQADASTPNDLSNAYYANPIYRDWLVSGNNVTMNPSDFYNFVNGQIITRFNPTGSQKTKSKLYIYAADQYGSWAMPFASLTATGTDANGNAISGISIDPTTNILTVPTGLTSGTITVNGVTSNGLVESVNIKLDSSRIATPTTTPVTPTTVTVGTGSLGVAGNGQITGLTAGQTYNVSVNGATATAMVANASGAITGLTNGSTYVVTAVAAANTIAGTFGNVLGVTYVTATLPTGVTSVTSVTQNGKALTSGTDYSVQGTTLSISPAAGVAKTDTITVVGNNGTTYTLTIQ